MYVYVDTNWRPASPLKKRVAIALFALGSAAEYRVIAEWFGVGKATVCLIVLELCNEVWEALSEIHIKKNAPNAANHRRVRYWFPTFGISTMPTSNWFVII